MSKSIHCPLLPNKEKKKKRKKEKAYMAFLTSMHSRRLCQIRVSTFLTPFSLPQMQCGPRPSHHNHLALAFNPWWREALVETPPAEHR
jgi:hypothetical protein